MSTKLVKYQDTKRIASGTTTVIYGTTYVQPSGSMTATMDKALKAMRDLFNTKVTTRGIARLAPEDEYVESTGVVVASKKAERTGCKLVRANYVKSIKALEDLVSAMKEDLKALDSRCDVLNSDAH